MGLQGTNREAKRKLDIEFISVNKPDAKKAAKILGSMLYEMLEKKRIQKQPAASTKS